MVNLTLFKNSYSITCSFVKAVPSVDVSGSGHWPWISALCWCRLGSIYHSRSFWLLGGFYTFYQSMKLPGLSRWLYSPPVKDWWPLFTRSSRKRLRAKPHCYRKAQHLFYSLCLEWSYFDKILTLYRPSSHEYVVDDVFDLNRCCGVISECRDKNKVLLERSCSFLNEDVSFVKIGAILWSSVNYPITIDQLAAASAADGAALLLWSLKSGASIAWNFGEGSSFRLEK